jgi:acyl carrier protein
MDGSGQKTWTKDEVFEALREILMASLGVEEDAVRLDASLVNDLGAESIDFLDIGFKVKQTFGVDLPMRVVQDTIAGWRNLETLKALLENRSPECRSRRFSHHTSRAPPRATACRRSCRWFR